MDLLDQLAFLVYMGRLGKDSLFLTSMSEFGGFKVDLCSVDKYTPIS
jgi:hypothetical protein